MVSIPKLPSLVCPRISNSITAPLGIWVGVDTGYVVERHAGDLISLKANHVADTLEFVKHLHSRTLHPIYDTHLRRLGTGPARTRIVYQV
jgi:hypothetical protein